MSVASSVERREAEEQPQQQELLAGEAHEVLGRLLDGVEAVGERRRLRVVDQRVPVAAGQRGQPEAQLLGPVPALLPLVGLLQALAARPPKALAQGCPLVTTNLHGR